MSSSRASLTKKACDGCKVRKVRCGGGIPCRPCLHAHIHCTYNRTQQTRGPQKLRAATRQLIEQSQRVPLCDPGIPTQSDKTSKSLSINAILSLLYIYHVRVYPVWPIVDVDALISALQRDLERKDHETIALATGLAAATVAQLRLGENCLSGESVSASALAAQCQEARRAFDYRSKVNLNSVRTAFFLHVYYENQQPGGSESVLYLREAITLAQMMYLHREASYSRLDPEEQQLRRRVLWLLFVTERGVCILHKLPVVLKTDTSMPRIEADDELQVLPAFLKLLALFKFFEQSRMFDIVEDYHLGLDTPMSSAAATDSPLDEILQDRFRDGSGGLDQVSDVQRADIVVTRHWMRILTWKALSHHQIRDSRAQWSLSPVFPLVVARDLVNVVFQLPRAALQAHGLGMQLKLHEIASSLADAVTNTAILPQTAAWEKENRPSNILARLHSILSAFAGGANDALVEILFQKMAQAHYASSPMLPSLHKPIPRQKRRSETGTASRVHEVESESWNAGSLQTVPGQAMRTGEGPGEESPTSRSSAHDRSFSEQQAIPPPAFFAAADLTEPTIINTWGDIQSSFDSLALPMEQLDTGANLFTTPESPGSMLSFGHIDTVFNNFIFNANTDYPSVDPYLAGGPSETVQSPQLSALT
ncbi:Zn(II)2Cys6 transcription factor [Aspergillus stella-maris]|uniref:Zn(II)2Cys6 transcription factor n=1 Tax=Aspergillus stella-maris TaxID=1810926 RepID=UPI003CCDCDCC